jgi:3-mercaptopyruvate sulfurtransferase SseA
MTTPVLVTVSDIQSLQQTTNKLVFIDSSFKRIDSSVPYEEFIQNGIPGAIFFDISQFSPFENTYFFCENTFKK